MRLGRKEFKMSVLRECQIETAKILSQLVPKGFRKQLVIDLVKESTVHEIPKDSDCFESLDKLIS